MNSKTSQSDDDTGELPVVDYWRVFYDLPDPYILFEALGPDYIVLSINRAREAMIGSSRNEVIGKPLTSVAPYNREEFRNGPGKNLHEHLERVTRTGRSYRLEPIKSSILGVNGTNRIAYLQTTYIPLRDGTDKVRYLLGSTHDVTDEVQAMARTETIESRLNAALTLGKLGSWVFDAKTGRITGDQNFRKLFFEKESAAKRYTLEAFLKSVHEEDRLRITNAVKRSSECGTVFEEECRVVSDHGSIRWVLIRGEREINTPEVFTGAVVDLTEQRNLRAQVELARQQDILNRQAARALQQRNEELEAISRSKDEFVALASHQLRTPATAVKQYIGMVLQGYVGDVTDVQYDVLGKAFESNERQIQIINQILSAARADTGKLVMAPMQLDMRTLTQGIAAEMRPTLEDRDHDFIVKVPSRPIYCMADLGYLRMAIENVLHNASAYTPKGGRIHMELKVIGRKLQIRISDTGVGIDKKDPGKLFVKFSRIHNPLSVEAGGSGIGLYLTAEIIRLHHGTVSVESRLGKGTTFAISLPLVHNKKYGSAE